MKKTITLIVIFLIILISGTIVNAADISLSANKVTVSSGDTVTLTYSTSGISEDNAIAGLEAKITKVDSKIEKVESISINVSNGNIESGNNVLSFVDANLKHTGDITISIKVKLKEGIEAGDISVPILVEFFMADENSSSIQKTSSATITVKSDGTDTEEPPIDETKSSDNTLKSLTVSPEGLSPQFSPKTVTYKMTVKSNVNKLDITAKTNDSKATYKITGNTNLKEGTNIVKITVTAENGSTKQYKITVTKLAEENMQEVIPNIVDQEDDKKDEEKPEEEETTEILGLKSLVITGVEISPNFDTEIYEYTATILNAATVEILATATTEDATVEIIGNNNLVLGENIVTILVKSSDGKETKTYQILIDKQEDETTLANAEIAKQDKQMQETKASIGKIILIVVAILVVIAIVSYIYFNNRKTIEDDSYEKDQTEKEENKKENRGKGRRFK